MFSSCLQRLVTRSSVTLSPSWASMPGNKRKSEEGEAKANKKPKPEKKNKSDTKWEEIEWASDVKTGEGKKWSLKLSSWNVDGRSF